MPTPANRIKFEEYGSIQTVQDWSTGLNCDAALSGGPLSLLELVEITTLAEPLFRAWANAVKTVQNADWFAEGVRSYYYAAPGNIATLQANVPHPGLVSGSNGASLPRLSALVCSLYTNHSGRSYRGRSYMPLTGTTLEADGNVQAVECTDVVNAYQALIEGLNSITGGTTGLDSLRVGVASAVKSVITPVTIVSVDSKVDTQRRREDKLPAAHTSTATI